MNLSILTSPSALPPSKMIPLIWMFPPVKCIKRLLPFPEIVHVPPPQVNRMLLVIVMISFVSLIKEPPQISTFPPVCNDDWRVEAEFTHTRLSPREHLPFKHSVQPFTAPRQPLLLLHGLPQIGAPLLTQLYPLQKLQPSNKCKRWEQR